jgi:hypothetical protein
VGPERLTQAVERLGRYLRGTMAEGAGIAATA